MTNTELVQAFIRAWEARETETILSLMSEDVHYHNIPMPPMVGQEAVRAFLEPFLARATEVEFRTHHIAETGQGVVLTERTDRFLMRGQWVEIRVMGVFEIADGKIKAWRDYFDLAQFRDQMSKLPKA